MTTRVWVILGVAAALGAGAWALVTQLEDEPRMVTTESDEAYALYLEGRNALERYSFVDAQRAFEAATVADSNFAMAYLQLGQALAREGKTILGRLNMRRAFERRENASEFERLWIEMIEARAAGNSDLGTSIRDDLVARFAEHPWVLRLQGDLARSEARHEDALAFYDRALELDPEAVDLHNLRGYSLLSLGEYEKAVQALQRYAFYAPDQANPHDSLGEAYLYTGRFEEATKEFLRALEIDPGFVWSAMHLADVLSVTGQIEKAHRVLDEVQPLMNERGWNEWHERTRLTVDLRAERWEQIVQRSDAILQDVEIVSSPSEIVVFAFFTRTMAQLEMGDVASAHASLEELGSAFDKFLEKMGDSKFLQQMADINRSLVMARLARAEGEPEKGIEDLAAAIATSPLSPHELSYFRYHLALAQIDAGRYDAAAATVDASLDRIPTLPGLNYVAAQARIKLGEREQAIEHLRTFLEVMRFADADLPRVARAQRLLQKIVPRS